MYSTPNPENHAENHGLVTRAARELGPLGCVWSARRRAKPVLLNPETDVGPYDLVFIGFPIWAMRPAPAVNSFIFGLKKCGGKTCAPFATFEAGWGAQDSLKRVAGQLERAGGKVVAAGAFEARRLREPAEAERLVSEFISAALRGGA